MNAPLLSHVWLSVTPRTIAHQTPLSIGFSMQEYWSEVPHPSPGDLPDDPWLKPTSCISWIDRQILYYWITWDTHIRKYVHIKSCLFLIQWTFIKHTLFYKHFISHKKQKKFSSIQSLSCVRLFATPWTAAHQASLSITNSWSLLTLMSFESVMPSNHLILCHPLLLLTSIFPSIRVFSNESILHIRWPKIWSFSFSISLSDEYSGLISFRMDWLNLSAVQGTLKSFPQHLSSRTSVLSCSPFFTVHLSHPYMTIGKTIDWLDGPLLAK